MSKIIKAVFVGRFCKTQRVFQFDTDDQLQIVNLDLPANYTVDFANSKTGESVSVLATSDTVQIPPDLFVPGSEIYAWVWISDSNGGHTRCEATIPIDPRARRTGAEPTPAQASAWDEAVDTLNETAADYEDAMGHGPTIIDGYWYTWDADAGEYVNTNVKAEGEDGEPGTPGVGVPSGGTTGQVLKKASGTDYDTEWADESGGGGTGDYSDLTNKPQINNVTLSGNNSAADLGLAPAGAYVKPSSGIPASDLSASVQMRLEPDVLLCMYGITQSGEIQDALDDGILPVALRGDNYYMYSGYSDSQGYVFTRSTLTDMNRISCKDNVWSAGTLGIPQLSSATPAALGTASAGSATSSSKADHVHPMPSAADVGAVASNQGVANANKVLRVNSSGVVVPEDNRFVVTLTPTAQDFSGVMDKTVAEIDAAYEAGKKIVFKVLSGANEATYVDCTMQHASGSSTYPSFNGFIISDIVTHNLLIFAYTACTNDGTKATYGTHIYPLATGQWTGGSY